MRALVCEDFAPYKDLKVQEVPEPPLGEGQVMIDVKAAGVNFPDILLVEGNYQMKPPTPFVPGMEIGGVVSAVGEGVSGIEVGQRVIAATMLGGFAEKVPVHFSQVIPMPDSMSFEEGAALITIYGTSYHGLKDRAQLKEGETVLVLGAAGGVGIAAVQLAKAMGGKVIAAASSDEKLAFTKDNGADDLVNYSTEDLKAKVKELTGGQGVDVVYDPVGGDYAEAALRASGWDSRYLVIGFASGPIPKIPLNLALLNSRNIQGVFWGAWVGRNPRANAQNMKELFDFFVAGKIKPQISAAYKLEQVQDAFEDLLNRRVKGKVVLTP